MGNRQLLRLDTGASADSDQETGQLSGCKSFFEWLNTDYATDLLDLDPWEYRHGPY